MSAGVTEVIKIVAPIALKALEVAAEALLAGPVYAGKRRRAAVGDPASTMEQDLSTYVETNFSTSYGYYYQALQSQPVAPTGKTATVVSATADIVVWDPQTGVSSITNYMQTILAGSVAPSDSINIGQNLAQIFTDRFKEESLEWTPLVKRFNQPDGLIADVYMVTSAAIDADNNRAGIASYCYVAYKLQ
jgi:hypothetical protein